MNLWTRVACALLLVPFAASAQYKDLDTALANLERGFGSGDPQAVVAGIADGDKVMLQFPGLVSQSGFVGRDQAAYLLDELFNRVDASGFERTSARKDSRQGQYQITATWTIRVGGRQETRDLYITLQEKGDRYALISVRAGSK